MGVYDVAQYPFLCELSYRFGSYQQAGARVFANLVEHIWEPLALR